MDGGFLSEFLLAIVVGVVVGIAYALVAPRVPRLAGLDGGRETVAFAVIVCVVVALVKVFV